MKKVVLVVTLLLTVFTLTACDNVCVGPECYGGGESGGSATAETDFMVPFTHINGHGEETDKYGYILYEFEVRDYVKYQITYLSCTCRPADFNYWQVMFIEVNKFTNDIRKISFGYDDETSDHPYTAGMWGDSDPTPTGMTLEDFETEFIPWLVGKSPEDLAGIQVFTNEPYYGITNDTTIDQQDLIDDYAGSSVSTNNMIRIVKALMEYHTENYS
ncbi:MAG: hypothetical protein K9L26_02480 [Candidatus Izimaplasma sp.]|nr:hypothetical protein [Candidatus Izimaplasma bacterium]